MKTNSPVHKYLLIGSAFLGLATVALGLIMLFVFPASADLTEGFRTPIIAFEFARSDADLAFLTGNSNTAIANRDMMDAGHRWDAAFPFAYAGFIALLLVQLALQGQRWLWLGVAMALVIIPLDLRENAILLAITEALRHDASTTVLLQQLHTATWLKWGALGASIAALSLGLLKQKYSTWAALGAITALTIALCWVSDARPLIAETMSLATSTFFLVFAIQASIRAWQAVQRGA
ncbi:MAG: hypothetical protein R3E64_05740 [Halioglobus sp.]